MNLIVEVEEERAQIDAIAAEIMPRFRSPEHGLCVNTRAPSPRPSPSEREREPFDALSPSGGEGQGEGECTTQNAYS